MKPEAIPFYGVGVALILLVVYGMENYSGYTFEEPEAKQYCRPQVQPDEFRWGRLAGRLDAHEYEPGQLVRFKTRRTGWETTSRVVALQGQRVSIQGGKVKVDGAPIEDPYARRVDTRESLPELIVPADCVFVLNDIRTRGAERMDSRNVGPIPVRSIRYAFSSKERVEGRRR